jgi:hypothetical protein
VALAAGEAGQFPLQPLLERHPALTADRCWCWKEHWLLGLIVEVDPCTHVLTELGPTSGAHEGGMCEFPQDCAASIRRNEHHEQGKGGRPGQGCGWGLKMRLRLVHSGEMPSGGSRSTTLSTECS